MSGLWALGFGWLWASGFGLWALAPHSRSVGERVQNDIHPNRISVGGETLEVLSVLALALPRIGDVGVVRHHYHQPAAFVGDAAKIGVRTVVHPRTLRDTAAVAIPELNRRHLWNRLYIVEGVHDLMCGRDVEDWVFARRQHTTNLVHPLLPRLRAPEIVDVKKAALEKKIAQPRHFVLAETD